MIKVPGFRSRTPWKMVFAVIGYGFMGWFLFEFTYAMINPAPLAQPAQNVNSVAPQSAPEKIAWETLGKANNSGSGAVDITFYAKQGASPARMNVTYHYTPIKTQVKDEIGIHLSKKIKTMYEKIPALDHVVFSIQCPVSDSYGNKSWNKAVSFKMTRDLYGKINWPSLSEEKFLDAAENVWIDKKLQ